MSPTVRSMEPMRARSGRIMLRRVAYASRCHGERTSSSALRDQAMGQARSLCSNSSCL